MALHYDPQRDCHWRVEGSSTVIRRSRLRRLLTWLSRGWL